MYTLVSFQPKCFVLLLHFLTHLSWKLKWAFLIACCPLSVFKLFTFSSYSPEPAKIGTKHTIQVCSDEGPRPFLRGDNYRKCLSILCWHFMEGKQLSLYHFRLSNKSIYAMSSCLKDWCNLFANKGQIR